KNNDGSDACSSASENDPPERGRGSRPLGGHAGTAGAPRPAGAKSPRGRPPGGSPGPGSRPPPSPPPVSSSWPAARLAARPRARPLRVRPRRAKADRSPILGGEHAVPSAFIGNEDSKAQGYPAPIAQVGLDRLDRRPCFARISLDRRGGRVRQRIRLVSARAA